jgi:hypothetical protein
MCQDEKEVGYLTLPLEEESYAKRIDKLFERYMIEEAARTDTQIAEALQTIATTYGPPPPNSVEQELRPFPPKKRRKA